MTLHTNNRAALAVVTTDFELRGASVGASLFFLSLRARDGDRVKVELYIGAGAIAELFVVLGVALLGSFRAALAC